jgi:hypothetical protein
MIDKLLALRGLVTPDPPQPAHSDVEHAHWDPETRTWRRHPPHAAGEEAAA